MKRHAYYLSALLAIIALPAFAAIGVGDKAPDFTAQATLAGGGVLLPGGLHSRLHHRGP